MESITPKLIIDEWKVEVIFNSTKLYFRWFRRQNSIKGILKIFLTYPHIDNILILIMLRSWYLRFQITMYDVSEMKISDCWYKLLHYFTSLSFRKCSHFLNSSQQLSAYQKVINK